jgi:GT2 family glycosyltransferase
VSHSQGLLVSELLNDLVEYCTDLDFEVILTLNLPKDLDFSQVNYPFKLIIINNLNPLGFGANHNQAFKYAKGAYFCVLNPDIRIKDNIFLPLISRLKNKKIGLIAPTVLNSQGIKEDNGRIFPSPFIIFLKVLGISNSYEYLEQEKLIYPDWVGGMCMIFPHKIYDELHGFDERYFLYYEDVDICARLRLKGFNPAIDVETFAIHNAQRASHKNFKYLKWHLASLLRFFSSKPYLQILLNRFLKISQKK